MVMRKSEAKLARLGHHTMGVAKCRVPTRHLHAPSCGSINLPIHSFQPDYVGLTQRNMLAAPFCECYKIFFLFWRSPIFTSNKVPLHQWFNTLFSDFITTLFHINVYEDFSNHYVCLNAPMLYVKLNPSFNVSIFLGVFSLHYVTKCIDVRNFSIKNEFLIFPIMIQLRKDLLICIGLCIVK